MSRASGLLLVLCSALAGLFLWMPSLAQAATGLSIQPIKVDETLSPGQSYSGTILLTNASDGPVDVETSLQDFIPVANADTYEFVGRAPGVTSVRDWISVDASSTLSLDVGEEKDIPFTITAPADAEPGDHFGVVFFKATPEQAPTGSLKVGTQVGMLVLITIPGSHLEKGNILSFSAPKFLESGPVPFTIRFQNTGTVHFEPKGSIVITNMLGQKAGEVPITGQIALPSSIKNLSFEWQTGLFAIGRYTAVATLYDGDGNALTSEAVTFWIVPVWYILSFLLALVVIYLVIRYVKRHVRISLR